MRQRITVPVSALILLSVLAAPAESAHRRRSLAMVPGLAGCAPSAVSRAGLPGRAQLRAAGQNAYPSTHYQKAMYLRQHGDINGALVEFLRAVQENPRQTKAFYEQAVIFKEKGYAKLAQSSLQQALSVKPDFREARVLLATVYLESGDLGSAARELGRSLGLGQEQGSTAAAPAPKAKSTPRSVSSGLSSQPDIIQVTRTALRQQDSSPPSRQAAPDAFKAASENSARPAPAAVTTPDTGGWMQIDSQPEASRPVSPEVSAGAQAGADKSPFQLNDLLRGIPGIDSSVPDVAASPCPAAGPGTTAGTGEAHVANSTPAFLPPSRPETSASAPSKGVVPPLDPLTVPGNQGGGMFEKLRKDGLWGMHMPDLFGGLKPGRGSGAPAQDVSAIEKQADELAAIPPVKQVEEPLPRHKRHRRKRVAGWMDRFMSARSQQSEPEPEKPPESDRPPMLTATIGRADHSIEELSADTSSHPPGAVEPPQSSSAATGDASAAAPEPVPARALTDDEAIAMIVRQSTSAAQAQATPQAQAAPQAQATPVPPPESKPAAWWPSPVDISRALKKMTSWLPLPAPRQEAPAGNLAQLPRPVAKALLAASGPSPLPLAKTSSALTLQSRQSRIDGVSAACPPLPPGTAPSKFEQARPAFLPAPASASGPLESVLALLPKEMRKNFAQVHAQAPGPVKIEYVHQDGPSAPAPPASEEKAAAGAGLIPQPVAAAMKAFENIVSPQMAPQPMTPQSAIAQALQLSPLPAPSACASPAPGLPQPAAARTNSVALTPRGTVSCLPQADCRPPVPGRPQLLAEKPLMAPCAPSASLPGSSAVMFRVLPGPGNADLMSGLPPQPVRASGYQKLIPSVRSSSAGGSGSYSGQAPQPVAAEGGGFAGCVSPRMAPPAPAQQVLPPACSPAAPVEIAFSTLPQLDAPQPPQNSACAPAASRRVSPSSAAFIAAGMKFATAPITGRGQYVLNGADNKFAGKARQGVPLRSQQARMAPMPALDPWVTRMKYLAEHGTASLGPGEAFMFSEETGEGVMFLPGGKTIRRSIAAARDAEEVARARRPDILGPGELQYNLSLLGKILPRRDETEKKPEGSADQPFTGLSVDDLMNKSQGLWGWVKDVLKF